MAILGGGPGGGGPIGSSNSFVGPQQALELVGDHAYAYNVLDVNDATATFMEFTTGNYYFVGTIQMGRNMKSAAETEFQLKFNDQFVYRAKFDNGVSATLVMPTQAPLPVIIPAYTKVSLVCEVLDAADTIALAISGRIYRG